MNKLKKCLITGLTALVIGLSSCRTKNNPSFVVSINNDNAPKQINYSETSTKFFIDKSPLGTLDSVVTYTGPSGPRVESKPTIDDQKEFTRLVRKAWNEGYLNQVANSLRKQGKLTRFYPMKEYE